MYELITFTTTHGCVSQEQEAEGQFRHFRPFLTFSISIKLFQLMPLFCVKDVNSIKENDGFS